MSNEVRKYDAIVVGAGPGGYPCAIRLAQLGVKTLCIEKEYWGGVCLNVGCIPSKALITAAKKYQDVSKLAEMGIDLADTSRTLNVEKLQEWKRSVVGKLTGGVRTLLDKNGADRLFGTATFTGPKTLEVQTEDGVVKVECNHLVLAMGSRPIEIPGFSYADERILDSTKALDLDHIPKKIVVIGGGYIGMELGMMLNKVGAEITIVEMQDQILPGFDPDVIKMFNRKLKKVGITVHLGSKALGWEEGEDGAVVKIETPKGVVELPADRILVTVGRRPNSEGLDAVGVEKDRRGHIIIDRQLKTNVPGVYAIGDVATGIMLAHKATHEGEICAEVIAGHAAFDDHRTVPAVVFTDPEIAVAGLQEHEAREKGYTIKVGKVPYAAVGRALTTNDTEGFYKVVLDAADDRVLGVTLVGHGASDLISEAALAIEMDAEGLDIGLTIHPHPTMGEGVMEAAKAALGQAVHILNR
ncbi:MAG: dihydrolipoamide dehydrogenase [Myxococcota bacterium]|jgi:dihydrolipoamide dehydrogenase